MDAEVLTGEALVAAHKRAVRNLRILGIAFPIVFVSLVVGFLWSIGKQFEDIDSAAVSAELQKRVSGFLPHLNESLGDVANAVEPVLYASLESEAERLGPQIEQRLQADVDLTVASARSTLSLAARASMARQADAQRAILIEEYPRLATDTAAQDKVLASVIPGINEWESRQLDATIAEHLIAIEHLRDTLQSHYTKSGDAPADAGDVLMTWTNLLNEQVGGDQPTLVADEKPKKSVGQKAAAGKK